MRYGVCAAAVVLGLGLAGCGLTGGNKGKVCDETKSAVQQYVAQIQKSSAADPAPWKQATESFAARLDALAKTADDKGLKKALEAEAASYRAAATTIATGDASQLNRTMSETPAKIGKACA